MSETQRFDFAFAPAYRLFARAFGIRPATAWVDVEARTLEARFGPWRVSTPLANVTDVAVTGPYAIWKTAGPARLAITDCGLTFATNGDRGVLISNPSGGSMRPRVAGSRTYRAQPRRVRSAAHRRRNGLRWSCKPVPC